MNETYGMFRLHHSIHAIAANGKNSYSYWLTSEYSQTLSVQWSELEWKIRTAWECYKLNITLSKMETYLYRSTMNTGTVKVNYPCNRPWTPIGLWDVEAPTFSRQLAHIWLYGCQPYAPAALYPQEDSWYSFLLKAESTPGP
jgi:hypothetical protein